MSSKFSSIFISDFIDFNFSFSTSSSFVFLQIKLKHLLYSQGSLTYGELSYHLRETSCLALQLLDDRSEGIISPGIYFHKEGTLKFLVSWIQFLLKTDKLFFLVIHTSTTVESLQKYFFISSHTLCVYY